jgi:hypothetical protein
MAIPLHDRDSSAQFLNCKATVKWPEAAEPHHLPNRAMLEACFHHASRWAESNIAPPSAPLMETDADGNLVKDADGNVKGGMRFPDIAVPAETFVSGSGDCSGTGYSLPFSREKLVTLYGTREKYLALYDGAADRLVQQGYILPEGAADLKTNRRWLAPVF